MLISEEKRIFLSNCYTIAENLGELLDWIILGREVKAHLYEDELILIAVSEDTQMAEIIRKVDGNSIIFILNGDAIRFPGDFIYLCDHIDSLMKKIS